MKLFVKIILVVTLAPVWTQVNAQSLIVPPSPGDLSTVEHLKQSDDYTVEVKKSGDANYTTCFVYETDNYAGYQHGGSEHRDQTSASFTNISFSGTSVDVRVTTSFAASSVTIRPLNYKITPTRNGNVITFTLTQPRKISIEVNNRLNPLFLFADDKPADLTQTQANATYYFGPGVHNVGHKKVINSNETVYMAAGSVVEGTFKLPSGSSNIKFLGHGIFSGGEFPHIDNSTTNLLNYAPFTGNGTTNFISNVIWEDITIVNSAAWVFAANWCYNAENKNLVWRNIKEVNWCGNTDVIWFDGTNNTVDDCFFFANDDITTHGSKDCTLKNIVFWQGKAGGHIFMTYDYGSTNNITYENIDIIGAEATVELIKFWGGASSGGKYCNNITFKNMRIEAHPYAGSYWTNKFLTMKPTKNSASNWLFENITLDDKNADEGDIRGNTTGGTIDGVTFRNIKMNGSFVTSLAEAGMDDNGINTSNIKFEVAPEINVSQNNIDIADNTASYSFGNVASGADKTLSFTIENKGGSVLNLTGTPKVAVTGTAFTLVSEPSSSIAVGGNATFQVKFSPTSAGSQAGTISIASSDADESPYNFAITGNDGSVTTQNKNIYDINDVKVYPNPVTNKVLVDIIAKTGDLIQLELFDLQGRLVSAKTQTASHGKNTAELYVNGLSNGFYLVKASVANEVVSTHKIQLHN